MTEKQRKDKLLEDLCYRNGKLNCQLSQKNIKIAERIRELSIVRLYTEDLVTAVLIKSEIDWLKELADI